MQISDYIEEDSIILNVKAKTKLELLDILIDAISKKKIIKDNNLLSFDIIKKSVLEREEQVSTGLGDGYAFPHARLTGLNDIVVLIAILEDEVDYDSFDGKPVKVACLILAPLENPTLALKFISEMVKLFSEEKTQALLSSAKTSSELVNLFKKKTKNVVETITAHDIMRPPLASFNPDTPLTEITRLMSEHRINSVVITNEENQIVGQITCDQLFNFGVPEFFKSLKSVSFIDEFDPFREYFSKEAGATAKDIMNSDYSEMSPRATLIEIVFALTVQKFPKVYVVENGKLIGIIDQSTVLDRIVNF